MKQYAASSRQFAAALAALLLLMVALNGVMPLNGVMAQETTPEPQPPTEIPTTTEIPVTTVAPSETPTPTETPPAELATASPTIDVSPEITAEITPDVTATASPEATAEVTAVAVPSIILPVQPSGGSGQSDTISVIVQLNMNAPIANLHAGDAQAVAAAEMNVQMAQDALSAALLPFDAQVVRDYDLFPMLALEVDAAGLAYLQSSPQVAAVRLNGKQSIQLGISTQVIGASSAGGAWAQGYTGMGYTVAILDTGTAANHPFLGGRVVAEACFSTSFDDSLTNCPNGLGEQYGAGSASPARCVLNLPGFECDHGTHVAGIAAGADPNGPVTLPNFSGVAQGANIIAINVFSTDTDCEDAVGGLQPCLSAFDWDILAGLDYVYSLSLGGAYNIAAVNMSLGSGLYSTYCDAIYWDYYAAINNLRAQRIVTVVAAGNNGLGDAAVGSATSISGPGCLSNVVSVGSMWDHDSVSTTGDSISDFSNRASIMTLLAPGESIDSSAYTNGTLSYLNFDGTSMATPMVTGALALLRQRAPEAPVDALISALRNTGPVMTDSTGVDYHRLSITEALQFGLFDLTTPNLTASAPGLRPTFSWLPVNGAVKYELAVVNLSGVGVFNQLFEVGVSPLTCTPSLCSVQLPTSLPGTAGATGFTWYVRASTNPGSGFGVGYFMGPAAFNVQPLTQNSPNTIVNDIDGRPNFTWVERAGATHYHVYVAAGSSGSMVVDEWTTSAVCAGGTCTYKPTAALPSNGVYNWFIQGYGTNGYVPWSGAVSFTLAAPPPANPLSVAPSSGATLSSNSVQFEWTKVTGAIFYELYVGTGTTVVHDHWYALSDLTPNGGNYRVTVPITGTGALVWLVRAYGPGGLSGGWSGPINFTITSIAAPTGLSDDQGAIAINRSDLTYTWTHNARIEWYELYIGTTGGTKVHQQWYQASVLGCAATCSVHPGVGLANGTYVWSLHGWSSTGGFTTGGINNSGWNIANITINLSAPNASEFVLGAFTVEPMGDGILNDTDSPTFTWSDISNALWYELIVINQFGAVVHDAWYNHTGPCAAGECMVQPANLYLTNGMYNWYVHAWGPGGLSTGGQYNNGWGIAPSFQIVINTSIGSLAPQLLGTIDMDTTTPGFRWEPVTGATWYQVVVVNNTTHAVVFQQWRHFDTFDTECVGAMLCQWAQAVELARGEYTWYVLGAGPGGYSQWSAPGSLIVAPLAPEDPSSAWPQPGEIVLVNTVQFAWSPSLYTTYYNLQIRKGGTLVVNTWYSAAQANCGTPCTVMVTLAGGDYQWQVFGYGPGTVGTAYSASELRSVTVLD